MKPARFDYIRTGTLAEAHAALAKDGDDARIIAGCRHLLHAALRQVHLYGA